MSIYLSNNTIYNLLTKKHWLDKEEFQGENQLDFSARQEKEREKCSFVNGFSDVFGTFGQNDILSLEEISFEGLYFIKTEKARKDLFKIAYLENYLFNKAKEDLLKRFLTGAYFSGPSKVKDGLPKKLTKHSIRVVIKRKFFNRHLLNALNKKLKKAGFKNSFERFPRRFVVNVAKKTNGKIMNMTLKEIFKAEEFYKKEENNNYNHNLEIVDKIEKEGITELNIILNRKISCLFEEYLNSEEFGKDEMNRLNNSIKEKKEYYIEKYIYLARTYIEFCNQEIELDENDF